VEDINHIVVFIGRIVCSQDILICISQILIIISI
jgi:hypothetical protein